MKMFIWNDPYRMSFGGSILYVVASNIDEAREIATDAYINPFGHGPWEKRQAPNHVRKIVQNEPDQILDVPCAQIYEWSE